MIVKFHSQYLIIEIVNNVEIEIMKLKNPLNSITNMTEKLPNIREASEKITNLTKNTLGIGTEKAKIKEMANEANKLVEAKEAIAYANMTEAEKKACEKIIADYISTAGRISILPLPGSGVLSDIGAMVAMTNSMAKVFHVSLTPKVSKEITLRSVHNVAGGYMVKKLIKEAVKIIPLVGKLVAEFIGSKASEMMLTMVGWDIAETLSLKKESVQHTD